jgi:hypothetical protein
MHYITSAKDGTIRLWGQISLQLMKTIHLGQTWVLAMTALPVLGWSVMDGKNACFHYHRHAMGYV